MFKFFKEIRLETRLFTVSLNWAGILAFVAFWTYGFFGALSSGPRWLNIVIFPVLAAIFGVFLYFWQKKSVFFEDEIVFRVKDLLVLLFLFSFLFPLSFANLSNSLTNDGLAHAQQAELHGISLIYLLAGKLEFLNGLSFADVLWAINFFVLILGISFYLFFKNKNFFLKMSVFSAVFIAFRLLVLWFGGSGGPHPPLRLFPLWLSGTVIYPTDFSFRLPQFLGLIFFGWLVWRLTEKRVGPFLSFLLAAASITIPVLWHAGILVEQSIWASIAWGLVLLYIYLKSELGTRDYLRLIVGVSIAILIRQTAFVALAPVFLHLAYDFWKKRVSAKEVLYVFSPILVMAPFFLGSLLSGTSATYIPGEVSYVLAGAPGLVRVWVAIRSGIVWNAITNSVQPIWLIFGGLAFIFSLKNFRKFIEVLALFAGGVFIFYLIRPGLWGVGRYQAEYIVPFAVLGLSAAVIFIKEKPGYFKHLLAVGLLALIGYNICVFKNIPNKNPPIDILTSTFSDAIKSRRGYSIITEFPYDYRSALAAVGSSGYADSLYIVGATYGVFPEILNGFTVAQVVADKKLMGGEGLLRNGAGVFSPEDINLNKGIKLVLIADIPNASKFSENLQSLGWAKWRDFKNETYGATIFSLIRR